MPDRSARERSRRLALLGTSALVLGALIEVRADAQCAPDPTTANGTTTCLGADTDGLRVTTANSAVMVMAGASVAAVTMPAIVVDMPAATDAARNASLTVAGSINGNSRAGVDLLSGAATGFDFYGARLAVTVTATSTISGATGITVERSPGSNYGTAIATIDNSGGISGTSGLALLSATPASAGFGSITNRAGGTIGAISGAIGILTNVGTIDGGSFSAIDEGSVYNSSLTYGAWNNSGAIRSSSSTPTIANLSRSQPLTNSGTIANTSTGAAIQGDYLTITNLAGGQIATRGSTAIDTTSAIVLANSGTITGNVVANPASGTGFFSTIDSSNGTIAGNVSLGRGNDIVVARYDGTSRLITGITGVIDAGGGNNAIALMPTQDLTISTAVALPTGFQDLRLAPVANATITLQTGFQAAATIELAGAGSIINRAALTTTGPAFVQPFSVLDTPASFTNEGSISATVAAGIYALSPGNTKRITNSGTITSTGNGVAQSIYGATFLNTGSVVAAGTAVSLFGTLLDNRGVISSSGDVAVALTGNVGTPATNSGRIEGAAFGVVTSISLTNSGTITATGTAVGLSNYGVLNNVAGGVVGSGNGTAVSGRNPYGTTDTSNARVFNAGTINGDVVFTAPQGTSSTIGNAFVALPGGVLNGNLTLASGDTLVTDLVNTGPGRFAGITGTVTSNGGLLRYWVSADATAGIGPVGPFATAGYELANNARLTLNAAEPQTLPLILAGTGTVDLTADITTINQDAVYVVAPDPLPGAATPPATQVLTLVNHGTISTTQSSYFASVTGAVMMRPSDALINEGTISATYNATDGGQTSGAAIFYGASFTNNGTVKVDGLAATRGVLAVVNTGSILQAGQAVSQGLTSVSSLNNSGLIDIGGVAVDIGTGSGTVINSGTIVSRGDAAVTASGYMASVTNLAGGTISGKTGGTAIRLANGNLANAGTINGDVDLAYFAYGGTGSAVTNSGTIVGSVRVGNFNDTFINSGAIRGDVVLGGGNDSFTEGQASSVTGIVDGGAGTDTYRVILAGDRTGVGRRTNFEQLAVTGSGRLSLVLDQDFQTVSVADAGLSLTLARHSVGTIMGTDASERVEIDGDVPSVALGGGDDLLAIGAPILAGRYDGGSGTDTLRLAATGQVALSGTAVGFEMVNVAGALNVSGTLRGDGALAFVGGGTVTVASGGTLAGTIDLGGASGFTLAAGGTISGTLSGGGSTRATIGLAGDRTISGANFNGFQQVATTGTGTLTLANGDYGFGRFTSAGDVVISADAGLTVSQIVFGAGNDHMTVAGRFSGSVDGGPGSDSIDVSGGTATSPVAFESIANVEAMRINGGFTRIAGAASVNSLTLTGGRLVGLAGSTITAPTITVGAGATFGSAGTVTGNISVAGTLSPGASPGTMVVNGNVALSPGSLSLFEITPMVSDKLIVNGQVSIAAGATLQIADGSVLKPGIQLDLVTATGGINGTFGTVTKPAGFFGIIVQNSSRISLLGQFLNDPSFSPQVGRAINYVNGVLASGNASAALIAAAPAFVTASGASNPIEFGRIGPQPYAAARQIAIEAGLAIVNVARGDAFATRRDMPGLFTLGTVLGGHRSLAGDTHDGTAASRIDGYGLLAGIGWANRHASIAMFGGYLNSRQHIASLGTRTELDGFVAGVQGSVTDGRFETRATIAYDGGTARTRRPVLDGTARGRYGLHNWSFDGMMSYALWSDAWWDVRPGAGVTVVRTMRASTRETGSNALALNVAHNSDTSMFVDGRLLLARPVAYAGQFKPFLSIGARYQISGRDAAAVAGFAGAPLEMVAVSAKRAPLLATASVGAEFAVSSRMSLFATVVGQSGAADQQADGRGGVRLSF